MRNIGVGATAIEGAHSMPIARKIDRDSLEQTEEAWTSPLPKALPVTESVPLPPNGGKQDVKTSNAYQNRKN
jgi:hypothetical protein